VSDASPDAYREAGVDTTLAGACLPLLTNPFRKTWTIPPGQPGNVQLLFGFFANVIEIGHNQGIAMTSDGVGSKVLIAQRMGRYDTVGIDCVAMNVNDLLCVGATPLTMVDILAVQEFDPDCLRGIAKGLTEGAMQAGISILGGELAQMRDVVKNEAGKEGKGFDLSGSAIGIVALDRIIVGDAIQSGDVVIGIESNGVHSNGLTLARNALANTLRSKCKKWCDEQPPNIGQEILDRLPPCPPTVQQAHVDNRFQLDNRLIRFFHPGAENCFRQSTITRLVL